jgi:hypothetical protein
MRTPKGRHRGPVDRHKLPRARRYLTAAQRAVLNAFAEAGGKAKCATGGKSTWCKPGEVLAPIKVFSLIRERAWIVRDPSALGWWRLTEAGKIVRSRGWWLPELGDV